ncbi:uncharacterized protein ARMOST_15520 [Armillaria ostoyae]|uniref:CxC2-like cysteine cluster KDZ transposase-associated domain-containing protein n=1 Tax=Armillaria ostoyae TaxID=47428 RepID=A0A284RTL0_ARMOS|nr:uncharacterized protein ARMOST_15520 [Armillaria ostoyae]
MIAVLFVRLACLGFDVIAVPVAHYLPLHIIHEWKGEHFVKTSLKDLRLRLQLGHFDGSDCLNPDRVGHTFVVMNIDGIHEVNVQYCVCDRRGGANHRQQLLHFGWYPATQRQPRTCATLAVLEQFHSLMLASKISGYDFYKALGHMTDELGLHMLKTKYKYFLCMGPGRRWYLIYEGGSAGDKMPCLSHPGDQSTSKLAGVTTQSKVRSILCVSLVANIRATEVDPGLHTSLTYFVKYAPYLLHLAKYTTQKDISTCSGFKTLSHAETKGEAGLRASGVDARATKPSMTERRSEFAIGIQDGMGRTDGEGIEHTWAVVNALAKLTKEMGPGSRHDTLDDHFSYHNFMKLIGLGRLLHRRAAEADKEVLAHQKYHNDFTNALLNPQLAIKWTALVSEWDKDKSKPTPYLSAAEHMTKADLKMKLKDEERATKESGEIPIHDISPTAFLGLGMLIEDSQQCLSMKSSGEGELTGPQVVDIHQCRLTLAKQIDQFRELQAVYMPGTMLRYEQMVMESTVEIELEDDKLWFPSDLMPTLRSASCHQGLEQKEDLL